MTELSPTPIDPRDELALLSEYSADTVYRLNYATMQYDYVSPAIERLLGYGVAEFRTLNLRELIEETRMVPGAMQKIVEFGSLEEARKRGETRKWHVDYRMQTKDGRTVWISDISHPWLAADGSIVGSVGCLRDITERVQSETHLQEEIRRMANVDSLTGLYHRQYFFDRLEEEMRRLRRTRADFSIAIIDIDHFKQINESRGSLAGDDVLREVASRIRTCLRDTDLLARIGGAEFGILLPETPMEGAFWVAERIRKAVADTPFQPTDAAEIRCTVSIGLAEGNVEDSEASLDLYRMADTRLYIAKNTGRNQISVDELLHMH